MKIIYILCLLLITSCSQTENIVEETQEQIAQKLEKEKAKKLILGDWKLYSYFSGSAKIDI